MGDTTEKTISDELRQAVVSLRCEHSFPVNSPDGGTLWDPAPCRNCGLPFPDDDQGVPDALREPLASWLESAAWVAQEHPQDPDYAGLPDTRFCTTCQDEATTCVAFVAGALAVVEAFNRASP